VIVGVIAMIAGIAVVIAIPFAIFAAIRVVNGVVKALDRGAQQDDRFESRLVRIEEAIDAMANQIERLRVREGGGRYLPAESDVPSAPSLPDDKPTL
jgi:hypothetical protein